MKQFGSIGAGVGLALLLAATTRLEASPELSLVEGHVWATGITRGSETVLLGVGRRLEGSISYLLHSAVRVSDDDGDGIVDLDPGWSGSPAALWAVIDLSSGAYALVSDGMPSFGAFPIPPRALNGHGKHSALSLHLVGRRCHALLVRPGVGAWQGTVADGSLSDGDGEGNGLLELAIGSMRSVGAGDVAPLALEASDVLVLIDPDTLQATAFAAADLLEKEYDDAH